MIIDEKIGRNVAEYHGLSVIGTLGILLNVKRKDLIASRSAWRRCSGMGCTIYPRLVEWLKGECGE